MSIESRLTEKVQPLIVLAIVLAATASGKGESIVNTFETGSVGATSVGPSSFRAQRFAIDGGPWLITSIYARLSSAADTLPEVAIYTHDSSANTPGTQVFEFAVPPTTVLVNEESDYLFSGTPHQLAAGIYWIVFNGAPDSGTYLLSAYGSILPGRPPVEVVNTGTSGRADFLRRSSSTGEPPWEDTIQRGYLWSLEANAVPEPHAAAYLLFALVLGGVSQSRVISHRRAARNLGF